MRGVKEKVDAYGGYRVGIYGTRNVCQRSTSAGFVDNCFVSDMSTGFSGNLGFKMPDNWAFDQFYENSDLGFRIDKVAVSSRDLGTKIFVSQGDILRDIQCKKLIKILNDVLNIGIGEIDLKLDQKQQIINTQLLEAYATLSGSWTYKRNDTGLIFDVNFGKVSENKVYANSFEKTMREFKDALTAVQNNQVNEAIAKLAPTIDNGHIETGICVNENTKLLGTKLIIKQKYGEGETEGLLKLIIEIYPKPLAFPVNIVSTQTYNSSYETANRYLDGKVILKGVGFAAVAVIIAVGALVGISELA